MSRRRLLLGVAVSGLVGGAAFAYVLPRIAGYQSVWQVVAGLSSSSVVALALLATEGFASASLQLAALLGIGAAVAIAGAASVLLWRADFLERFGELSASSVTRIRSALRKEPVAWSAESLLRNRSELVGLLRQRWHWLTLATVANQLTGYLMLETSVRAIGIGRAELSIAQTFAAWSLGRLLASLPITPGGIGIVELGLTGTLVGFGAPHAPVVAAVLVYRVLSVMPTLALGLLAIATWRRRASPE